MNRNVFSFGKLAWQALNLLLLAGVILVVVLLVKALRRYLRSTPARQERAQVRKSLGETICDRRKACKMTQEFVAEALGVSRQAVSKWESGASEPNTSNLLALAKLFQVDAAEMLRSLAEK